MEQREAVVDYVMLEFTVTRKWVKVMMCQVVQFSLVMIRKRKNLKRNIHRNDTHQFIETIN